ncbi:hypothetical protein F4808DRAFT_471653 [Astrocystis sublimbata]|nr:hypothetical protein F4808DRAFT_471653 [Astrocystis sublimbata]
MENPRREAFSVSSLASSLSGGSISSERNFLATPIRPIQSPIPENTDHGFVNQQPYAISQPAVQEYQESNTLIPVKEPKNSDSEKALNAPRPWQAAYLQNSRLVIFPICFLSFIVAVQVLIHISQVNDGLATPWKHLHYLWTFGPMAALTLVAAFWNRVEFQLKSITPWAHMVQGDRADKTLLLDYRSMFQPMVIVTAVKFRDWAVASASLCSLTLRVTIILSTSLIALTLTEVHDTDVPVALRSSFVESAAKLGDVATRLGSLPYYTMRGLSERKIPYPDGTWNNYAFQQFALTDIPNARLNISVEGFTSSLSCEPVSLNTSYSRCDELDTEQFCWALETKQCQYPIQPVAVTPDIGPGEGDTHKPSFRGAVGLSGCNGSEKAADVVMYMVFGGLKSTRGKGGAGPDHHQQSAQIACRASYAIHQVDVTSNHTGVVDVSKSTTSPSRHIEGLAEGKMLELYLDSFESVTSTSSMEVDVPLTGEHGEIQYAKVDLRFSDALEFSRAPNASLSDLFNESSLEDILSRHYQQTAVFIGRSVFSTQDAQNITGTVVLERERLLVSAATGHTMTALLGVAAGLCIMVLLTKPALSSLPKNPNNVIETAQLLAGSKEVLDILSGGGPTSRGTMENRLRQFDFKSHTLRSDFISESPGQLIKISASSKEGPHELRYLNAPAKVMKAPLVLNLVSIVGMQLLIIATIVALEIILRVSGDRNDFVDVSDQPYLHFAWTVLPALFMSLVSMYLASVDSEIRSLTPYSKLSKGCSMAQTINMDLLDGSTPRLLRQEYRSESLAALSTSICMLAASFLTIFVGSLYNVITLPVDAPIKILTESSFNISRDADNQARGIDAGQLPDFSSLTSSLILESNLSYPVFTYEALAFPEYSIASMPNIHIASSDVINATVPALRSKMACTRYVSSEIHMEVESNFIPGIPANHQAMRKVLAINIDGEEHQSRTIPSALTHNMEIPIDGRPDDDWVFGFADSCKGSNGLVWCTSDFLYVWGHKTNSTTQAGNHVAALVCNETIEAVDVLTTFLGPQLSIDSSSPPRVINDSARKSTVNVHSGNVFESDNWLSPYGKLAQGVAAPGTYLWPFFDALTTSRYAIPLADLYNHQEDEAVARAIVLHHGIIRAQVLSEGFRGPANATNATLENPPADTATANDAITYNGTLRRSTGRRRLAQDPATTRVLEALLVATLVLSAAGRLLMRNTKLLPRSPTSIANVAALVADGNIVSLLPENAQLLSDEEILKAVGSGHILRMGWWTSNPQDDASQRFGIFAVRTSNESVFE